MYKITALVHKLTTRLLQCIGCMLYDIFLITYNVFVKIKKEYIFTKHIFPKQSAHVSDVS